MSQQVSRRERRFETWAAVLMSLATVATAWCAYQSAEWGGEQSFMLGESTRAGRESALQESLAMQRRSLDAALFMEWIGAIATDNEPLEEFYLQRFRPGMRIAVDAWLATDPRNNPEAPPHPFVLPEYRRGTGLGRCRGQPEPLRRPGGSPGSTTSTATDTCF